MDSARFNDAPEAHQTSSGRIAFCELREGPRWTEHYSCSSVYETSCRFFESQGVNHMDAEDLAVEASLRWAKKVDEGGVVSEPWFRMVCRNLMIDWFRRSERQRRLLQAYAELIQDREESADETNSFEERVGSLDTGDQMLLNAHYVDGLTAKEIAHGMSLTVDCVKQRLHRARERLNVLLFNKQPKRQ